MLCSSCSKLTYQHLNKSCMRCQGSVTKSIQSICDFCSKTESQCSVCLKKMQNAQVTKYATNNSGCGGCRSRR